MLEGYTENEAVTEQVLIRLEADFDDAGAFGKRTMEVTDDAVKIIESNGTVSFRVSISDIKSARNEPLVGGGRLELLMRTGELVPVIAYSMTVAAKFSEAARGIEQLAKGEPLLINLKSERVRCAKCDRLLPEKDGICPACINRQKTMLRIGVYLRPYWKQALFLTVLSILSTAVNLAPPFIQGTLIDKVLQAHRNLRLLGILMLAWLGVLGAGIAIQILNGRLIAFLGGNIAADIRSAIYRAIEMLQLSYFDKKQVGAITSRVTQDTDRVWGFLTNGVPFFISNGLLLIGILAFLFDTNWRLTLWIMAPFPIVVAISGTFWKPVSQRFHRVGQKWARFHVHLNESISGIRVVKAFAQEDNEYRKFSTRNCELRNAGVEADTMWFTVFGAMSLFTGMGALINWTVGGYMVYSHQMSIGDFWKICAYLNLVYGPLQWFAQVNNDFSRAMAGAERIFEVIDTDPEPYVRSKGKHEIVGEVSFNNVRFGYDKSNPVLKGMEFTAKPGEMIGLVGKSGAGKSTTINLLCRFYEPDSGSIVIDGIDYRDISLQEMRRQIGIVLQEPFLFNGTIAENIAYGRPGAHFDEIVEAAKAANAHIFVLAKSEGYDTAVGERGAKLSGGERQRISIARAILHDPKILILDEATSSVDVETERQIQEALGRLTAGRTTFAIAHRLTTLRNATRLVVIDKGEIAEMGTHEELMEKQGKFYELVQSQAAISGIVEVGA
jgi:ATP-binding cassette subfamily B protein